MTTGADQNSKGADVATKTVATSTVAPDNKEERPMGILEEDDEFEEFPIEDWEEGDENKLDIEQWEADWDDDNLDDELAQTLRDTISEEHESRKELDRYAAEQAASAKQS